MNNRFYACLYNFGQQIKAVSISEKVKLNNYFIVVHPGVPVVGRRQKLKPMLDFVDDCPEPIRYKIINLYQQAFVQ
jgi:hypothetical protein